MVDDDAGHDKNGDGRCQRRGVVANAKDFDDDGSDIDTDDGDGECQEF